MKCQVAARVKFSGELQMSCDAKFQLSELRIAAAVKFYVDELQIELQKLDAAAKFWYYLHLHFPFHYNTNLRQLQLYEAVKFPPPAF